MTDCTSNPSIEVKNLAKSYRLGSIGFGSFIEDLRGFGIRMGYHARILGIPIS
jgi:hypothetical protein